MNCYNVFIILGLACWHDILIITKKRIQFFIYRIQFFVRVIMNVAVVAIVAYLLKRTLNPFSNVGRVDAMVTSLAFGHILYL